MNRTAECRLIRTSEELERFIPQWRDLWERDRTALPFQRPEWLVPWWRQFGNEHLNTVVISRDGVAIGLLPFYVFHDAAKRQRQLLPLGVGTTDYLDGVFAAGCEAEDVQRGIESLRSEVEHDVFCAVQVPSHSRLLEVLKESAEARIALGDPCSRMPAVTMAELPQKIRRNAMYYRNRAQRMGRLELVQAGEEDWSRVFEELRRLHTQRWRERGEEGVLVDERVVAWHREAIPLLLRAGLLRLMALRLDDRVIAVLYSLIDRERARRTQYFYITAYSPEFADVRPGTLLIAYAAEWAAGEGVVTIDMLRGDENYKQMWHTEKTPTWRVMQPAGAEAKARSAA